MALTRGKWMQYRLYAVCLVFILAFAAVMFKSYHLQVVDREELMKKAQRELETYLAMGAVRGEIFDVNGEKLAASLPGSSLHADPKLMDPREIKDENGQVIDIFDVKAEVARKLHETIGLDEEFVTEQLAKKGRYNELARFLDVDQANAVAALKLPGLILGKTYRRSYPNRDLAANFLGYVGKDGGLEGLELVFDEQLKAGPDKVKVKRDGSSRKMIDKVEGELEQSKGSSVVLTIDRRIQYITEKALANAAVKHKAENGMALVMRPKTGAIVAMATWPSYDPNEFGDYKKYPVKHRRNSVLTDQFEPGSTFKVFVVAAALEEGLINPSSMINCENGAMRVANHTVKDTHSYGDLTVSEVIKYSSNIGSLKVGGILGNNLLHNYLTRFSFGEQTGLGHLPGEAPGKLKAPDKWRQVEAANIAFGQGLTVTTLQMVMAMGSIANQGILMKPYIVDRIVDEDGRVVEQYEPHILRQVVSPLTARQVSAMLRMAVQKGGTATRAEVAGYPVAGKTGTAQKVGEGSKSYTAGKYVSSFIGFAPYHDPQLTVMVVLNEPKNGYYGGTVAAPAFREIMENSLPLLDIPPTDDRGDPIWPTVQTAAVGAPGLVDGGQPTNFIRVKFPKNDRGAKGPITFASLSPEKAMAANGPEPAFIEPPLSVLSEPGVMPNLAGLSMRQVMEVMSEYGLDLEYAGSGHVVRQEPRPGAAVDSGQTASVIFER